MNLIGHLLPGLKAYPDIHPMLVHFPAALFPLAFLFGLLAAWRYPQLALPARLTLVLGTVATAAAALAGFAAQDAMPHGTGTLVASHRTFMLVAGAVAILLSILALRRWSDRSPSSLRLLLAGLLVLNGIVVLGADRGALVALDLRAGLDLRLPKATGPPRPSEFAGADADTARGRRLYAEFACADCHNAHRKQEAPGIPPRLEFAGSMLQQDWLQAYLEHPRRIRWADEDERPVMRMPDFELSAAEARDLAAYLALRKNAQRFPLAPVATPPLSQAEADEGRALVGQYACKGCHVLGGSGNDFGPALDGVGKRLSPAYIFAFLKDPKGIIPGTPMKDFHLDDHQARALTAYLSTLTSPPHEEEGANLRR